MRLAYHFRNSYYEPDFARTISWLVQADQLVFCSSQIGSLFPRCRDRVRQEGTSFIGNKGPFIINEMVRGKHSDGGIGTGSGDLHEPENHSRPGVPVSRLDKSAALPMPSVDVWPIQDGFD